jgi:hypothetical protein
MKKPQAPSFFNTSLLTVAYRDGSTGAGSGSGASGGGSDYPSNFRRQAGDDAGGLSGFLVMETLADLPSIRPAAFERGSGGLCLPAATCTYVSRRDAENGIGIGSEVGEKEEKAAKGCQESGLCDMVAPEGEGEGTMTGNQGRGGPPSNHKSCNEVMSTLRAFGRLMCNFLFRETCYNETFRSDVFASPYCPLLFAYLAFDSDRLFCTTDAAMDTLATFDPQLRQSWDHLLVPGPAQAELLASIPLESLFSFEFSADCLSPVLPPQQQQPPACPPLSDAVLLTDSTAGDDLLTGSTISPVETPAAVEVGRAGASGGGDLASLLRGLGRSLTVDNVSEAVRLACKHKLVTERELGLRTIRNAFYDLETSFGERVKKTAGAGAGGSGSKSNMAGMLIASVSLLQGPGDHLRRFLCGGTALMEPSLVLSVLRLSDEEEGSWDDSWLPAYESLRKSIGSMTTDQLELFLLFTVSSRMVDPGKTVISVKPTLEPGAWPTSSTCEHSLTIPVNCDDLHTKIIEACQHAHSSGFLRR